MRLQISRSAKAASFYVTEGFRNASGKVTSRIVEKLGTEAQLREKLGEGIDVEQWAKDYVAKLNAEASCKKEGSSNEYPMDEARCFNVGYLVLQQILYQLGFSKLIKEITSRHHFTYNLEQIIANLIYARILAPRSKLKTYKFCEDHLLENFEYDLHQVYRVLDIINLEDDFIQQFLYKQSSKLIQRNTSILFYDCTNFFFEISEEDEHRKRGISKENSTNPLVGMGLFMDGSGLPLGVSIFPGNQNEQQSLQPLEKKIIKDFDLPNSRMIICTDAGLASFANRRFNTHMNREFIVTQPIKTLKKQLQDWVIFPGRSLENQPIEPDENIEKVKTEIINNCWRCTEFGNRFFSLDDIDEEDPKNYNRIFYKEKYLVDPKTGFEQRMIVTYSIKYKNFMEGKRSIAINRAQKLIDRKAKKRIDLQTSSDVSKFISVTHSTKGGEQANQTTFSINKDAIEDDAKFDGFYAVCTSINKNEMPVEQIISINRGRWEIEESFRILKTSFKSRPVYVYKEERIKAHFTTCFMALLVLRIFEQQILKEVEDEKVTIDELLDTLRDMVISKSEKNMFTGSFKRTKLTNLIEKVSGFKFCKYKMTQGQIDKMIAASKKFKSKTL